jgi:hypothetical protein
MTARIAPETLTPTADKNNISPVHTVRVETPRRDFHPDPEVSEWRAGLRAVYGSNGPAREWKALRLAAHHRKEAKWLDYKRDRFIGTARALVEESRRERIEREQRQSISSRPTQRRNAFRPYTAAIVCLDGFDRVSA